MKTTEKRGITANITINGDIVTKTVVYNNFSEELLEREEYWLRKLTKYNISPKFIGRKDNSITMSYCGEPATLDDFQRQDIQVQLIKILRVLLENYCFYNDFKLSNFTIKEGRLYIIDFGWCPVIKEDYTCIGRIQSDLNRKPYGNVFNLFNIFK
jgi:tRNA A-37 threonylcarbamoyl transferase component Bud32